jgi:hypothetical protein
MIVFQIMRDRGENTRAHDLAIAGLKVLKPAERLLRSLSTENCHHSGRSKQSHHLAVQCRVEVSAHQHPPIQIVAGRTDHPSSGRRDNGQNAIVKGDSMKEQI